jgi:RNA polymerase sigma factor (sigma-70 family)
MTRDDWLAGQFEERRGHLQAVAYRMLGSVTEADDALQESWLRLSRADTSEVGNLGGWLTTVVARVCLDMLRSRRARPEEPAGVRVEAEMPDQSGLTDPEQQAVLADSVGMALLIVLDTLAPAERTAFVLHDMFAVPFEDIGPIVGRSAAAARQLASRARRRVRGASPEADPGLTRQRELVAAFLAASRAGDFQALLDLLDPGAEARTDAAAAAIGTAVLARGGVAVASAFSGRAQAARLALIDGVPGAVWAQGGEVRVLFRFAISAARIRSISLVADPAELQSAEVEYLSAR